jgi:hypothetical protein
MPKYTKKSRKRTNKTRKQRKQKPVRKISNPSGLSHLYSSLYGPRAYKGGFIAMTL